MKTKTKLSLNGAQEVTHPHRPAHPSREPVFGWEERQLNLIVTQVRTLRPRAKPLSKPSPAKQDQTGTGACILPNVMLPPHAIVPKHS